MEGNEIYFFEDYPCELEQDEVISTAVVEEIVETSAEEIAKEIVTESVEETVEESAQGILGEIVVENVEEIIEEEVEVIVEESVDKRYDDCEQIKSVDVSYQFKKDGSFKVNNIFLSYLDTEDKIEQTVVKKESDVVHEQHQNDMVHMYGCQKEFQVKMEMPDTVDDETGDPFYGTSYTDQYKMAVDLEEYDLAIGAPRWCDLNTCFDPSPVICYWYFK